MWGLAIGAALSAASSIAGGIMSSNAAKKAKSQIESKKIENQNWYNYRYNEDALQRADAQRVLTQTREYVDRANKSARAAQAVTGGTDESVAAAKEANNKTVSDTMGNIAAASEQRKDAIEQEYRNKDEQYDNALIGIEQGRAQGIATATQTAGSALGSMAMSLGGTTAASSGGLKNTLVSGQDLTNSVAGKVVNPGRLSL